MIRLVTRGRFTHDYLKGLLAAPEDREAAVRKVIEAVGGKVISFYVTTGETDFLLVSEADEAEGIIAALMAAAAAGTISDVRTGRAWTGAEFKSIMEKSGSRVPTSEQTLIASRATFEASAKAPGSSARFAGDPPRHTARLSRQPTCLNQR